MAVDAKSVFVKSPSEKWSSKRANAKHHRTGDYVLSGGQIVESPSELDHAKFGALLKHCARGAGLDCVFSEAERGLLEESAMTDQWIGSRGGQYLGRIPGGDHVKALLNDVGSGGSELVPAVIDQALITYPLLSGELFPFVDVQAIDRGSSVEAASLGNVTINSGGADAAEIPLFNTASWSAGIDTPIHTVDFAVEIGNDFLSDSVGNVGNTVASLIGSKLSAWLDEQIINGDGTTEPEGILTASGTVTVNSTNGATGPPTVADYLNLLFSVPKQYRNASNGPTFISNDVSYSRLRGVSVSTTDQRLIFGNSVNDYNTLSWRHAIEANMANAKIIFGCLAKYRMYRRLGLTIKVETQGNYLSRRNLSLIIARARFGGQVMDGNAFAIMPDAQS